MFETILSIIFVYIFILLGYFLQLSTYPKLISKKLESMASASPCSRLKSPIPNEYNIDKLLTYSYFGILYN
jgi:CRISPR/Cas system-associated protein endoribonuclease Cas2